MIIDKIGTHKIERYSSINDLPIPRFMNFNRFVMIDAGIGSDVAAIDAHDKQIILHAKKGDTDKVIQETLNRNESMRLILSNSNPKLLSYAVTVKSIDGVEVKDFSDDACRLMIEKFSKWGATKGFVEGVVSAIGKKLENELDDYFPAVSDNPQSKEMFAQRKRRVLIMLDKILGKATTDDDKKLSRIEDYLYKLANPLSYTGREGREVAYVKSYEEMSFVLSQNSSTNPKAMTVLEYYQAWEVLKKQFKKQKN